MDPMLNLPARLANDFVLVLAAVAMKFVVAQTLPPVSYVTLLEGHRGDVRSVAFASDGRSLASGSSDRLLMRWRV